MLAITGPKGKPTINQSEYKCHYCDTFFIIEMSLLKCTYC